MYSCLTRLFEIELIIYIKMNLALNNLQMLIRHKTQQTKPNQSKSVYTFETGHRDMISNVLCHKPQHFFFRMRVLIRGN